MVAVLISLVSMSALAAWTLMAEEAAAEPATFMPTSGFNVAQAAMVATFLSAQGALSISALNGTNGEVNSSGGGGGGAAVRSNGVIESSGGAGALAEPPAALCFQQTMAR